MNRVRLLTVAVIGLLLLNFGVLSVLFFRDPGSGLRPPREEPKYIIIRKLHLDAAQQQQYQLLIDEHRSQMRLLEKESRDLKNELYSQLKRENPDSSLTDPVIQKIADTQKKIERVNFAHFQKIRALCRPEQLADFNSLVEGLTEIFAPPHPPKKR